jgi:ATP citrate (pro-S)-lyase
MQLFVRRGGPNYKQGLEAMKNVGIELGIAIQVFGPEASMTGICKLAIEYVKQFDEPVAIA